MSEGWDDDEPDVVLGVVVEQGRGSLPFSLVHGEALVAAAAWALGEAGVLAVDLTVPWDSVREAGAAFCLHDSLCPMTPPDFIASCVARAVADDVVVVAVRPVTDTVKRLGGGLLGATLPREDLVVVCSPIVLPPGLVARLEALPSLDFAVLASVLADRHRSERVEAPVAARRVDSTDDLAVLEALTSPAHGAGPTTRSS